MSDADHEDFADGFLSRQLIDAAPEIGGGNSHRPTEPRRVRAEDAAGNWSAMAPRWVMVTAIGILLTIAGGLVGMVVSQRSERDQRVEDAIKDSSSKYQSRIGERQAASESEIATLKADYLRSTARFTDALERQAQALNLLTVQFERLNVMLAREERLKR